MDVSLVIPGRNASRTLRQCLESVVPLLEQGKLGEILFVDDGSTDQTAEIVRDYPVRLISTKGVGPGAARNLGWRAARGDAVWFIDSDCVAEPAALDRLVRGLEAPDVAGVGGSYGNLREDSLLACLIHEEIRERHLSMPEKVDYLGSFNVIYRRSVLERVGGFDEKDFNAPRAPGAEDADLSYRITDLGHTLRFDPDSRVGHHHPTRLRSYLRSQRLHGGWGVRLYYRHRGRAGRNSYSGALDHLQPPLAAAAMLAVPMVVFPGARLVLLTLLFGVAAIQSPLAVRLVRRTGQLRYAWFVPMSVVRACARAVGMVQGALSLLRDRPEPHLRVA